LDSPHVLTSNKQTVFCKLQNQALVTFLSSRPQALQLSAVLKALALAKPMQRFAKVSGCDHALSPACSSLKSLEMIFIVCSSIPSILLAKINLPTLLTRY
jgi:hypothetical protein